MNGKPVRASLETNVFTNAKVRLSAQTAGVIFLPGAAQASAVHRARNYAEVASESNSGSLIAKRA